MNKDHEHVQVDKQVVIQLKETAARMTAMLDKMADIHTTQDERVAFLRGELLVVRDSLHRIAKVLLEGNGDKPLLARTAVLEERADYLEESLTRLRDEATDRRKSKEQQSAISRKGKWALAAALIAGVSALVAQAISLII